MKRCSPAVINSRLPRAAYGYHFPTHGTFRVLRRSLSAEIWRQASSGQQTLCLRTSYMRTQNVCCGVAVLSGRKLHGRWRLYVFGRCMYCMLWLFVLTKDWFLV